MTYPEERRLFLSPPHLGREEIGFVMEAFESNYIAPLGPMVDAFEREFAEYTGNGRCAAVSSGTAAMHLALRSLGVGPGDEVIGSTLTFVGGVTPIVFQGAAPAFVDSERTSLNMDPELLAGELERCSKRGRLPKAVVPTDLYGQCCDLARIVEICDRYDVPVISDSAEAVGARYLEAEGRGQEVEERDMRWRHAGKGARAAVFSFNGNKIITTSGGGMLASDDEALIEKAKWLSQQARDRAPHYEHSTIGYNYRMSNVLAAIGRGQLRSLDARVKIRRSIFSYYRTALGDLPGVEFVPEPDWSRSNRWLTVVLVTPKEFGADREKIRLALEEKNIESRPVWKPMHLQPVFRGCRVVGGKVAEELFSKGLCLPSGTAMAEEDMDRVVAVIRDCRR